MAPKMKSINVWLDEYGESHKNSTNKKIHWFCVPAIMFSFIGFLVSIPHSYFPAIYGDLKLNWGILITICLVIYYFKLSKKMAYGMSLIGFLLNVGNYILNIYLSYDLWVFSLSLFIVAWIGQFIGHKIEGKKPSFLEDIEFLLIGPAWLLSFIYKKYNIKY